MWNLGTWPSALFATVFPIAGRTKQRAESGKLHDHRGLQGAPGPAHGAVITWPPQAGGLALRRGAH